MNKIADSPIQTVISAGKMEDFFTMLKEFDSIKTSDCLIRNNMSIDVHITRKKGKLGNWVVTEDLSDFSSQRKQKTGKTMKSFYHYFSGEEKEVGIDLAVIAHKDTKKKRTYDGSIITEWFSIPICSPYEDEEGKVSIKTIELTTSKEEYRLLMETRVAIYDEFQDKIYPFLQVAIISVGKYLDCSAIFKIRDDYMLGTAIVLAEKISKKNVSLIIKDTESRINPILSVAGKYTKFFPPTEFFTNICSQMAAEAFFLNTWQVFDDRIIVDFVKPGDCYICSVTMGLIPGIATRATVYAMLEGTRILLSSNAVMYSNGTYNYKKLFEHLFDNIMEFEDMLDSPSLNLFCATKRYLKYVKKAIGKKRFISLSFPTYMKRGTFFTELLRQTKDFQLSEYYDTMLITSYHEILKALTKEENNELA